MNGRCRSCTYWKTNQTDRTLSDNITHPVDPDTYEPMEMPFEVRECAHPRLAFCERPVEQDGFAVADGSQYMATLYTAEDFGCVKWEQAG